MIPKSPESMPEQLPDGAAVTDLVDCQADSHGAIPSPEPSISRVKIGPKYGIPAPEALKDRSGRHHSEPPVLSYVGEIDRNDSIDRNLNNTPHSMGTSFPDRQRAGSYDDTFKSAISSGTQMIIPVDRLASTNSHRGERAEPALDPKQAISSNGMQDALAACSQTGATQKNLPLNLGASMLARMEAAIGDKSTTLSVIEQQKASAAAYFAVQRKEQSTSLGAAAQVPDEQEISHIDHPYEYQVEFENEKRRYLQKKQDGSLSHTDEIAFLKLQSKYQKSSKKVRHETTGDKSASDDDEDMFVQPSKQPKPKRKAKPVSTDDISEREHEARPAKKARQQPQSNRKSRAKPADARPRKLNNRAIGRVDHTSLGGSDVFADLQAAGHLEDEQPVFDAGQNRRDALNALVRNVPESSRKEAITDKILLKKCLTDFTGHCSVKPEQGGKWLVNGMQTTLTPHQIIGTSFMRRREALSEQPRGGILADQMGLGKTLMTLANIVNGRPNPNIVAGRNTEPDARYTTLIVVPPALMSQWHAEIKKHTKKVHRGKGWGLGTVLRYSERECSDMDEEELYSYDIVLTTYNEVARSWPVLEMPKTDNGLDNDSWMEDFLEKRGLLHKAKFLRVCLDEAHCIRNPETRTSTACRNLIGEHCWAITGTPMVNGSFDLYALFEFIGHPTISCPAGFRKKHCDPQHPMSVDKLTDDLSSCMSRCTHRDHLFGARLVNLPKAENNMVHLAFSRLEHDIYEIVRTRFATRVQQMAADGTIRSKLTHVWVLMLRLRQLTAHPLMIQGDICSCLEREDFEKLERLVEHEDSARGDGANLILSIRNILIKERASAAARVAADHQDGADEQYQLTVPSVVDRKHQDGDLRNSGDKHGKNMRFSKYLNAIKASQAYQRMSAQSKCTMCTQTPYKPYITDCFHIYCKVCLDDVFYDAAAAGLEASCALCTHQMTAKPVDLGPLEDDSDDGESQKKKPAKEDDMTDWLDIHGEVLPSTKTIATKSQILNWWDPLAGGHPGVKVIIFTQWLGMVKVLSKMCQTERWGFCTLTGNMSRRRKDKELEQFKNDSEKRILISSLKCGGIGLNLTVASKVIIIDPWWNDAMEQQAFCRVFRIGQDKETSMVSLVIEGSVDDHLSDVKTNKKLEIDKVMRNHKERHKVDLRDILSCFGEVGEDERGRLIFKDLNNTGLGGFEDEI